MKNLNQLRKYLKRWCGCSIIAVLGILLLSTSAAAAESGWRPIYDDVMLWINFFIFVFLIVKYGGKPLTNYLKGQTDEVADEIHRLQKEKNALEAKINKTKKMIEDSTARFEQIKSRIMEDGERVKRKIIEDAQAQSKNIIEIEKLKATHQVAQARDQLIAELVDEASLLALKKIPAELTESDHNKFLDLFLSNIPEAPKQSA